MPPGYESHIHTFRLLNGSLRPGGVLLDQQTAATLQARIGDTVTLLPPRPARQPQRYKVSGVALITAPDQVFQPLNPSVGPAPAQPPGNAVIMETGTFQRTLGRELPPITASSATANSQPGAQKGVQWEVQAQLDPAPLSAGSPSAALKLADQTRLRVERSLPGQVQFVDNLSDSLNTAAGDSLYAQALYILLAVPGSAVGPRASPTSRRSAPASATGATLPCCAHAARGGATCWRWRQPRASRSASSPASSGRASPSARCSSWSAAART